MVCCAIGKGSVLSASAFLHSAPGLYSIVLSHESPTLNSSCSHSRTLNGFFLIEKDDSRGLWSVVKVKGRPKRY